FLLSSFILDTTRHRTSPSDSWTLGLMRVASMFIRIGVYHTGRNTSNNMVSRYLIYDHRIRSNYSIVPDFSAEAFRAGTNEDVVANLRRRSSTSNSDRNVLP